MKNMKSWGYLAIITMLWWGVIYPEFSLTGDNCCITDETGMVYEISNEALADEIMNADSEQIVIKSRFWELLKEWSRSTHEEECKD